MIFKKLGNTSSEVSAIGFGCGIGGSNAATADYSGLGDSLKKSLDLGVNFVDTSPVYGNGESEKIVGGTISYLANRGEVMVGTKVAPGQTNYAGILHSVEVSLRRLKVECIDLYQIHWPNPAIPIAETVAAMEELVAQGKIKNFGVSNFSMSEIVEVRESLKNNSLTSVQAEYNFCERSIENDVLPFCQKNNITLIAYTPLMRGRMAGNKAQVELLQRMALEYDATIAQIILSWIVKNTGVIVLSNTKNLVRVEENFSSAEVNLSESDYETISAACVPPIERIDTKLILDSSDDGETGYRSAEEALRNCLGWTPSPQELGEQMLRGEFLKPVRLFKDSSSEKVRLRLLEGKLRYWAWVTAFGWDRKIPSIIWED